ncbi:hypothetical protein GBF38_021326 [Nibea albiflora]|uniref:Uncharacterized protein n=1 Tax=Nibea albiflora TaxID=240163 RepID=A0ACB7FFB8_NIBAL|nr:hypothetical protein GBF38_021326 [Nibea albiflora]
MQERPHGINSVAVHQPSCCRARPLRGPVRQRANQLRPSASQLALADGERGGCQRISTARNFHNVPTVRLQKRSASIPPDTAGSLAGNQRR